jgi:hypothetical protein
MPRVYNSIIVPAPIERVWSRINDFHDFSWAPSLIASCEKVGSGGGSSVGARRLLNGVFLDTLVAYSTIEHRLMYSMDEGPSPVSSREIRGYVGDLHLLPVTAASATFAEWTGTWDTWEGGGEAAVAYMNDVYRSLLVDLAASFEAKQAIPNDD